MTTEVVTADPEDPVRRVAEKMVERRVSGLPVVDAGGRLLGMVAHSDDVSHRFRPKPATYSDPSQPGIPMIPAA